MTILFDQITVTNLFFCIVIIIITIYGYHRIRNPTVLFIGAGFTAFGMSHLATLLEMRTMLESYLIIIRSLGYILVTIGSYFVILEVIRRMDADNKLQKAYNQIEERVRERTDDLEQTNAALSQEITLRRAVESTLRESEEKYRNFFTTSQDCVFISSPAGQLIDFNNMTLEIFGYERREELAKVPISIFYEDPEKHYAFLDLIHRDKYVKELPVRLKRKDGTVIEALITSVAQLTAEGSVKAIFGTIRDITMRKRAEEALRESEARLNSIVHGSPMLQFVIDKNHRIISWNKAIEEYSGVKESDVLGSRDQWKAFYDTQRPVLADLLADEKVELLPEWYKGKISKSRLVEGAFEATDFFPKMGESGTWLYFTAAPIRNVKGEIIGAVETLEDITERKSAEQALKENEEKFISIFQKTPDPILILNSAYQIVEVNRGFEKIFEYINEELKGKRLDDLGIGLTGGSLNQVLEKIGDDGHFLHEEMNLVKLNGVPFIAEVAISRIIIHSDPCLLIQVHDIDEIRRAHKAVAQVNHKLKILSSITRHDILNKVMVTSFFSEEIRDAVTDQALWKQLDAIKQASSEIQALIEFTGQYQDLGVKAPDWQQINMILKHKMLQGLLIGVTLTSDLISLQVYADRMLENVIYNLVENSVRHGQNLSRIHLSSREYAGDLIIWYEDDGGGIIEAEKEKSFEKGFGKNTGLGLFLIREILSITGISIIEIGEPGVGVRFEMKIPKGGWRYQDASCTGVDV